jgi:electron transfer flavoprotein beta subunit
MAIVVLYKWTRNPQDAVVAVDGTVRWDRAKPALSEYDPVAIELGRHLADASGTHCVGVSVGGPEVASALARKAVLARGLDSALVIADEATSRWNATDVARALAHLVRRVGESSLVLAGDVSADEGAGIVPALTAGFLGWSCLQGVRGAVSGPAGWQVEQLAPGGSRTVAVNGPLVASVATDAVTPRVPGVREILAAGKKPLDTVALDTVPAAASTPALSGSERPDSAERLGRIFKGDMAARELAAALRADGVLPGL